MDDSFRVGNFTIEPQLNRVSCGDRKVQIESKSMEVLLYLSQHPKKVLPKERILQAVWPDTFVTDNVLTHAISVLRRAFGDDPANPEYIQTIPRKGYRLIAELSGLEPDSRYHKLESLGRGAMGEVFVAEDRLLKRKVALKFVRDEEIEDERARRMLDREAKAAAALDHPFICKVYETGELKGRTFIAMEYVSGQTLRERLAKGPLSPAEALRISIEIAEALEVAHARGIIHRDLKPSNVILTEQDHVKITDFGIAKRLQTSEDGDKDFTATLTAQRSSPGTVPYMSPEQVKGQKVDTRSDIYSLGVLLYEMLTGVNPFRKPLPMETAAAIQTFTPAPLDSHLEQTPEGLEQTLSGMLAKDASERYQAVRDVQAALRRIREVSEFSTGPPLVLGPNVAPGPLVESQSGHRTAWSLSGRAWSWLVVLPVLLLILLAAYWTEFASSDQSSDPQQAGTDPRSIAVLPLRNLSGDPDNEWFSEGITEDIITQLSKLDDVTVVAMASVMRLKDSRKEPCEIAASLGVESILSGSVQRSDGDVRITAQLIDCRSERNLWAETYDRELKEIFAIQSDVAGHIAAALKGKLSPQETRQLMKRSTESIEAYNLYLQGRHFLWQGQTPYQLRKSIGFFQQAIQLDSGYAKAYAGLAEAYFFAGWRATVYRLIGEDHENWQERAEESARMALALDDSLAEAHVAMGMIRWHVHKDFAAAEEHFEQAIELNPQYVHGHREYGMLLLLALGRVTEAVARLERAVELDPLFPASSINLGLAYLTWGDFDEAIKLGRKVLELEPGIPIGPVRMAHGYLGLAEYEEAEKWIHRGLEIQPEARHLPRELAETLLLHGKPDQAAAVTDASWHLTLQGHILMRQGLQEEARRILEQSVAEFPRFLPVALGWRASTLLGYLLWDKDRVQAEKMLSESLAADEEDRMLSGGELEVPGRLYDMAMVYAIRGKKEEAYHWLQKAIDKGWRYYDVTSKDPIWADFHAEPRFQQMMAAVKAEVDVMRARVREMEKEWEAGSD